VGGPSFGIVVEIQLITERNTEWHDWACKTNEWRQKERSGQERASERPSRINLCWLTDVYGPIPNRVSLSFTFDNSVLTRHSGGGGFAWKSEFCIFRIFSVTELRADWSLLHSRNEWQCLHLRNWREITDWQSYRKLIFNRGLFFIWWQRSDKTFRGGCVQVGVLHIPNFSVTELRADWTLLHSPMCGMSDRVCIFVIGRLT